MLFLKKTTENSLAATLLVIVSRLHGLIQPLKNLWNKLRKK